MHLQTRRSKIPITCPCGNEFHVLIYTGQKYCSRTCKRAANKDTHREREDRYDLPQVNERVFQMAKVENALRRQEGRTWYTDEEIWRLIRDCDREFSGQIGNGGSW